MSWGSKFLAVGFSGLRLEALDFRRLTRWGFNSEFSLEGFYGLGLKVSALGV